MGSNLFAQSNQNPNYFGSADKKWVVELPIWIPGFAGSYSYGDITVEGEDGEFPPIENPIEPPPEDGGNIISRLFKKEGFLKFFYMGKIGFKPGKFLFQLDFFGGDVGGRVNFRYNNTEIVQSKFHIFIAHMYAGYSVYNKTSKASNININVSPYLGFRYIETEFASDLNRTENFFSLNPGWYELILGGKLDYQIDDFRFVLDANFGGFIFEKNTISYKLQVLGYYAFSDVVAMRFGWTDMDINHDSDFKGERLIVKTHLSGPNLGVAFYF